MTGPVPEGILVVGGTGFVGRRLVPALIRARRSVRVLARSPEAAVGVLPPSAEVIAGDLLDPESLDRALQGVVVVY